MLGGLDGGVSRSLSAPASEKGSGGGEEEVTSAAFVTFARPEEVLGRLKADKKS